jgi:hypothetical protein
MRDDRRLAGAATLLIGLMAACTPAGTAGPTGGGATSAASPAATTAATPSAAATQAATAPAATTAPTTAPASPAATPPGASPGATAGTAQLGYATFAPRAGSGTSVTGAATLIESNGSTVVVIGVVPSSTDPIAAAIQEGTCAGPDPLIKFDLTPLVAGASVTTVDVSLAEILAADHVVNLFVAGSETESSISCGDIQELPASAP